MYGLSNGKNIFDLRRPLKSKVKVKPPKIEEHFYSGLQ